MASVHKDETDVEKDPHLKTRASTTISSTYTGSGYAPPERTRELEESEKARITPIPDEEITDEPARGGLQKVETLFDRVLPERRRYCGHSRKYCLVVLGIVMGGLLMFIIALAVALTRGGKHNLRRTNASPGAPQHGQITYYAPALGACGDMHTNGHAVAAISIPMWDTGAHGTNPNNNSNCRRQILITNVNGRSVNQVVTVADRCVGCALGDLDVSQSVFEGVADLALGRTSVEWHFIT